MTPVEVLRGYIPVVLAMPHTGTHVPDDIMALLNDRGQGLDDTDWHIHRLYEYLLPGATAVRATFHRYVIDANRDPAGNSLYPGQNTTDLCPVSDFDGNPIYKDGMEPDAGAIAERISKYHAPYHAALAKELVRVKARHGVVILFDCHSIRSEILYLFDGTLPDFNIGTNDGVTCDAAIEKAVVDACEQAKGFSTVLNGRFKGGWTTRHYAQPDQGQHCIQMELAQSTYMQQSAPWTMDKAGADTVRLHLRNILETLNRLALSGTLN